MPSLEYPWWQPFHSESILEVQFEDVLSATNCTDLVCLRSLESEILTNASRKVYQSAFEAGHFGFGDYYYGPSVDGDIIQDLPTNEFSHGHFHKVPLLIDHDVYEGEFIPFIEPGTNMACPFSTKACWRMSRLDEYMLTLSVQV